MLIYRSTTSFDYITLFINHSKKVEKQTFLSLEEKLNCKENSCENSDSMSHVYLGIKN